MLDRLLTLDEVSEKTGISKAQLRWLRANHRLPCMGIVAGRLRGRESDVDAWIDDQLAATRSGGAA